MAFAGAEKLPNNRSISVVVPTFGRGHLLETTIPTLLQDAVLEVIIIDDCSPDDTPQVVARLSTQDARIRYVRNERNKKQAYSKNVGIKMSRGEYIYFADDDSVVTENAFSILLDTLYKTGVDIVGASTIYLREGEGVTNAIAQRTSAHREDDIVSLPKLFFNCGVSTEFPIEVPLCQAAFLVRKSSVAELYYDASYIGNCYREETDFLLRYRAAGGRIYFDSRAVQVNLPPSQAVGGARGRSKIVYELYSIYNTIRFLFLRRKMLKQVDPRCRPFRMFIHFMVGRLSAGVNRAFSRFT